MCVAAPGKILSINGTTATVAYSATGCLPTWALSKPKWATGCWCTPLVIQVLSESQAQEINNLLAELETLL